MIYLMLFLFWYVIGVWVTTYLWTADHDLDTNDLIAVLTVSILGPFPAAICKLMESCSGTKPIVLIKQRSRK